MSWRFTAGLFFLAMALPVRAGEVCSQERVKRAAEQVKLVQAQLLAVKVGEDGTDWSVKDETQKRIRALKDALTASMDAFMACERSDTIDARDIESRVAALLGANLPDTEQKPIPDSAAKDLELDHIFGADIKLHVRTEQHKPALVGIVTQFAIACGTDNMLLLYQWSENGWRQVLRWQSDVYSNSLKAFGDFFEYAVFGEQRGDDWFVAAAHGKPSCTSSWSAFDLDVIRAQNAKTSQSVIFHKEAGYRRDVQPKMNEEADGFELRLKVSTLDANSNERAGVYHYRLHQGQLHRYQPVAFNARDFLDEWLQADWMEATEWTARADLGSLGKEHDIIAEIIQQHGSSEFHYGAVRACAGRKKLVQVELDGAPTGWFGYFQIEQDKDVFTLVSGSNSSDPKCAGPDLMARH